VNLIKPEDRMALQELKINDPNFDLPHLISNYLYFPSKDFADKSIILLSQIGFEVVIRLGADGVNWLVMASQINIPSESFIAEMRLNLENIANKLNGEYDGWEISKFLSLFPSIG
jgi:hypothetical protein